MVLSDQEIKKALEKGDLLIEPFCEKSLQPASYDLTVGREAFARGKIIDLDKVKFVRIERGDFAVLTTVEKIHCDLSIAGKFGLRSYLARKGLVLLSGVQIDPGYTGTLTAFLFNLGPEDVIIQPSETFATVEFSRTLVPASRGYDGPYQNQKGIPMRDLECLVRGRHPMSLQEMQDVILKLADRYRLLNRLTYTIIGSMVAVFISLIAFIFYLVNLILPRLVN
jgi:dCTP deaminase